MKASFAVDSEGIVRDTSKALNIFRVRNANKRTEELNNFITGFISSLEEHSLCLSPEGVFPKIQPMYTEDRLVFFSRIPLEASSQLVKQAHALRTNRPVNTDDPKLLRQMKSVFCTQEREKTKWWLLLAEEVLFERNIFDCEWEKMVLLKTVTYSVFLEQNQQQITEKEIRQGIMNYGYCFTRDVDITDTDYILNHALIRNGVDPQLDEKIRKALMKQYYAMGFANKQRYANQATYCLLAINDFKLTHSIYSVYMQVKGIIQEFCPTARNIHYSGNVISFEYNDNKQSIYVCNSIYNNPNDQTFIINGNIINGIQELRCINFDKVMQECHWYNDKVIPNIKTIQRKDSNQHGR